jgi:hypothetical protein
MNPWDFNYIISGWMLVALVILPFLFGLLYGMKIAYKRFMVKLVREIGSEKLKGLINGEDGEEDADTRPNTIAH